MEEVEDEVSAGSQLFAVYACFQNSINPNLPIRQYLDENIMPQLIEALKLVAKAKPEDPIEFIGEYMLRQAPEKH